MKFQQCISVFVIALAAFAGGVMAGDGLSGNQARQIIARTGGSGLSPEDIHIRRLDIRFGGREATVEAFVRLGFQLRQEGGQWVVSHLRTGDRRWDSVELITAALRNEKINRTSDDLRILRDALEGYRRDRNSYPESPDFAGLIDTLLQGYLSRIVREDHWHQGYVYQRTTGGYRIASSGPDHKPGTADDIVLENGDLKAPGAR